MEGSARLTPLYSIWDRVRDVTCKSQEKMGGDGLLTKPTHCLVGSLENTFFRKLLFDALPSFHCDED